MPEHIVTVQMVIYAIILEKENEAEDSIETFKTHKSKKDWHHGKTKKDENMYMMHKSA